VFPILLIFAFVALTVVVIAYVVAPRTATARVAIDTEPDLPRSFGVDMAWIAVRSEDRDAIVAALELKATTAANWNAGIGIIYDAALDDAYVFVSPPVKGWTFVAGLPLPLPPARAFVDKLTPLLMQLGRQFRDVQYFASYPVIDFYAWARVERGRIVRAFAMGDEVVIWDRGRLTREEKALGLKLFEVRGIRGRIGDAGQSIILYPTEQQVLRMASGWSVDPSMLERLARNPGAGLVAPAPPCWRAQRLSKAA